MSEKYKKLELNERNVFVTLKSCMATDKSTNICEYSFMPSNPSVEKLAFDLDKIDYTTIEYLMGQLKAAHEHKKILSLNDMQSIIKTGCGLRIKTSYLHYATLV